MQYVELGKTGMKLSRLGFGAMRFHMKNGRIDRERVIPLLHRAFELGINFVDTSTFYCSNDSENVLGEAISSWKGKIYVSTKNAHFDINNEKGWWNNLENSLKKLRVNSIDLYNQHGIGWQSYVSSVKLPDGFYRCLLKAKEQGMIKHIAFSFHDSAENLKKIADDAEFVSVILQYNILDRKLESVFPYLRKKDMGIIVMGPLSGGRLGNPLDPMKELLKLKPAEIALRFVFSNPDVDVALSGMSDIRMVEENVRTASMTGQLTLDENRRITEIVNRLSGLQEIYCTGCKYCMPCPHDVNIPEIFQYYIWKKVYGIREDACNFYGWLGTEKHWIPGKNASACQECGECLEKCPQKIDIVKQLKEAHKELKK